MEKMMELMEKRRSIRAYKDIPVTRAQAEQLARAAQLAPSGRNEQTRQITVLMDQSRIDLLSSLIAQNVPVQGPYNFFGVGTLILLSDRRDNALGDADCACALQNIFLMATAMDLGSCWVNQLRGICDRPMVRSALSGIGIPADHIVWGIAAVGVPDQDQEPRAKWSKIHFVP